MLGILAAAADDLLTTYIEYDLHFQVRAYSAVPTTVIAGCCFLMPTVGCWKIEEFVSLNLYSLLAFYQS